MFSRIRTVDVAVAVACLLTAGLLTVLVLPWGTLQSYAVVLSLCGLLVFRRSAPLVSAVGIYAVCLAQALLFGMPMPINIVVFVALYSVTVHGPRLAWIAGAVGGYIGALMFASMLAPYSAQDRLSYFVPTALAVTIAWALGLVRRSRLERTDALAERAKALEEGRSREAELAVAEERARIAREMHDVVAHSLAVIIAQADGGRYAAAHDPEQGVKALETISDIGRAALADIRRILGVLRSDDGDGPLVAPQPGAHDLPTIVERVRETGARVSYTTIGEERPLMPGMGLTLQRICQEALTNAMKHAGPGAKMSVLLKWNDDEVVLQVDDDGRGAAALSDGGGTGIIGMRERAALFGGTVHAAPRATGGYRVRLTLPLHPVQDKVGTRVVEEHA